MKFIGRFEEIRKINDKLLSTKQENILIYGRRRIGKSFLIKKVLEDFEGIKINYQCKDIAIENTIVELTKIIEKTFNLNYKLSFSSIDEILDYLFSYKGKIVVVIDEYSYLQKRIEGLDSILQEKIDKYKYDSLLKLIISGSAIDVMKDMIEYSKPLYGRFSEIILLTEHDYYESSLYYQNYSDEDKVLLYSVFGGEPFYNSLIDTNKSAKENIIDLVIKKDSIVEITINNILSSELSKINGANDVLQAISLGVKKNDDINSKTHINNTSNLSYILNRLLQLDLIKKITPINDANNRKKTQYLIKNNTIKFYYKFIYRFLNIRDNLHPNDFYEEFISNELYSSFIPEVFEDMSKQYLIRCNKNNKIKPLILQIGTYWYDDPVNKTNGQFDVVTLDKKGYIFYEVKYTNEQITDKVIKEEIEQLSKIKLPYYNLGFISKKGFNTKFKDFKFITLSDFYSDF